MNLSLSTINHDQIRHRTLFIVKPAVTPTHSLPHGLEVINPSFKSLHIETAVFLHRGITVTKDNKACSRILASQLGDVKTFDILREDLQIQVILQFLKGI